MLSRLQTGDNPMNKAQQNYITALAIYDAAFESDSMDMTAFEDALELVDLREHELFVWARDKAAAFCRALGKSQSDSDAIEQLFDTLIAGGHIHAGKKERIISLCMKLKA
jgi:hypothetical protein